MMTKVKIGIVGGSGIDADPGILENARELEMDTPFGKPASPLIESRIGDKEIVVLARHGKGHTIMPTKVPFRANIWALKEAGCTHILATTACGSLKEEIRPGQLVFPDQFIDFTKHRALTFHEDKVVHTPMAEPFCAGLRKILSEAAKDLGLSFHPNGTILTIEGPRFSTRAESHLFRQWGADVINMSSSPEVMLAREARICYAGIAMATDYDCWKENETPVTWEIILDIMKKNAENVRKLLLSVVPKINFVQCSCRVVPRP